jgi:hypothetical protein
MPPRNPIRRALCAVLFILVGFNHAVAQVRIEASTGGVVSNFGSVQSGYSFFAVKRGPSIAVSTNFK